MPDEATHVVTANHNQKVIDALLPQIDDFSGWITTIAFYKALHVVEAVFFNDPRIKHGKDHASREKVLKSTPKYNHIYRHYKPLFDASLVARYLSGGCLNFSDYLTPDQVKNVMLGHYLHQVEKSAAKFLRNPDDLNLVNVRLPKS